MRLKEIEVIGFKSFMGKTNIKFEHGITAIVGPNGSGKSNISDAIRWVLGEQSIKTLRGSKMEDVIFAGTNKRKALGYAEVTITFDNHKGIIPIDYDEVGITRRVFRSGESEFYINKNSCRLKDIRELLMDTGIGKEGYSIIGQGKIDEILSHKSEDRRHIFEEAAGIVKYKSKKEESERKLVRTEENLVRIKDIISELEKRERLLSKEARRADEYRKYYDELKFKDIAVMSADLDEVDEKSGLKKEKIKKIEQELENLSNENYKLSSNIDELKQKRDLLLTRLEEKRRQNSKTEASIYGLENELNILQEKKSYSARELERIKLDNEAYLEEISSQERDKEEIDFKLERLRADIKAIGDIHILEKEAYDSESLDLKKLKKELEDKKDSMMDLFNSRAEKQSELNSIKSFNLNIDRRSYQLKNEREKIEANLLNLKTLSLELEDDSISCQDELKNSISKKEDLELKLAWEEEALLNLDRKIHSLSLSLETNKSNYKLFTRMEDSYEGYYKGVKNILKEADKNTGIKENILGVVAELIKVDKSYELAISTALGSSAQHIVTPDQQAGKNLIEYLSKIRGGRITCLPLDRIRGKSLSLNSADRNEFKLVGLASELVSFEDKYKEIVDNLLGRTVIANTMDDAIRFSNKYRNSLRIVTLDGNIINPGGSMTGGSQGASSTNILTRKNEIERIQDNIRSLNIDLKGLESDYKIALERINRYRKEVKGLEELELNMGYRLNNLKSSLSHKALEIDRLMEERSFNIKEESKLKQEIGSYRTRQEELSLSLEDLDKKLELLKKEVDINSDAIKEKETLLEDRSRDLNEKLIDFNKKESQAQSLKELIKDKDRQIEARKFKIEENKKDSKKIGDLLLGIDEKIKKIQGTLGLSREDLAEESSDITSLIEMKELKDKDIASLENDIRALIDKTGILKDDLNFEILEKSKEELKRDSILNKLYEKYQLKYDDLAQMQLSGQSVKREELDLLKSKIKKLGSVNLNAAKDYKDLKDRLDFMLEQKDDLEDAKKDLDKLILNMEKEMSKMFKDSFEEINRNFKVVFRTLFNGGEASLVLEDKNNLLETGIDIMAKPPGKKLQNLSSLSGGERSLVAVAILFAILKMKPSPFCVLDEIDAALDEANIGRYTGYLQDISQETQFIIITHRKRTMEMADILYGVTMEEEGVSKLIAVELKDFK